MKQSITYSCLIFSILFFISGNLLAEDFPVLKGPYLGQKPPGSIPEVFAPGIISAQKTQGYPSFTASSKEFYFYCSQRGGWLYMKRIKNTWQPPTIIPFSIEYGFREANVTADGSKLLFCTKHQHKKSKDSEDSDLWMMERKEGVWQEPVPLNPAVNSNRNEAFPTLAKSGNLYFFRNCGSKQGCEILVSKYINGAFAPPKILGPSINTAKHECDPIIDPDERCLIYCVRDRKGGFGNNDLYVSFKTNQDTWLKSINMGSKINSQAEEITPHLSADGKYLFFSSNREGNYDIYWVDAKIVEELKPKELK